jgi:tripartite-type tricarboxylate transporter receptor subunit TctC
LGLVLAGFCGSAAARTWPTKQPIRAIVPFSPGSAADIIPRVVLDQVLKQIGQAIVIENRVGARGMIGTVAVARADADGYTLLITSSAYTITPSTYAKLPYDPARNLSAVIPLANLPNVLVVAPAKFKSIENLVATGRSPASSHTPREASGPLRTSMRSVPP